MISRQTSEMAANFIRTLEKSGTVDKGESREFTALCRKIEQEKTRGEERQPVEIKLISKRKAAEILSVSVKTVDRLSASGALQKRMVGGSVRFLIADVYTLAGIRTTGTSTGA